MLHLGSTQLFADFLEPLFAGLAIVTQHPDLDQFMTIEGLGGFPDHRIGQTMLADHDHRVEGVGQTA